MSILQKLNTGGWDQTLVDEARIVFGPNLSADLIMAMLDQIEDTLDHDDVVENLRAAVSDNDDLNDEVRDLENKNDELVSQIRALKNCRSGALAKMEEAIIELDRYKP